MSNRWLLIFGSLAFLVIAFMVYQTATDVSYSESGSTPINILAEPQQQSDSLSSATNLTGLDKKAIITPVARYSISGMLVSKHRYGYGIMKRLAPYDYAIIWGNAPAWLPYVKFSQARRYCFYRYKQGSPVDKVYLQLHMSNNHMIPANSNLGLALRKARKGDKLEVSGYLVNVKSGSGRNGSFSWNTSLRRDDTGDGACEIVYFTRLRINDKIYE